MKRFIFISCDCCCIKSNALWLIWGISKCDLFGITAAMVYVALLSLAWCLCFEGLWLTKCWTQNSSCVDSVLSSLFTPVIVCFPGNLTAIWEQCLINTKIKTMLVNRENESALNNSPFHENQHIDWNTNIPRHWHAIGINSALMWPGNKL